MFVCCGIVTANDDVTPEQAALVKKAVKSGNVTIEVNFISPSQAAPYPSSDGYTLTLKKGKVNTHLPFIGTSTSAPFGSSDGGINFKDCTVKVEREHCEDCEEWRFDAKDESDLVSVTITIWPNATAEIVCVSTFRSTMRYSGFLK